MKKKLFKILLLFSMVPLTVMAVVSYFFSSSMLESYVKDDVHKTTVVQANRIEEAFAATVSLVSSWAHLPVMKDIATDDDEGNIANLMEVFHSKNSSFFNSGRVINPEGVAFAAVGGDGSSEVNIQSEWFQKAFKGEMVITSVAGRDKNIRIAIGIPTEYDPEEMMGVLEVIYKFEGITGFIKDIQSSWDSGKHGLFLVDDNNTPFVSISPDIWHGELKSGFKYDEYKQSNKMGPFPIIIDSSPISFKAGNSKIEQKFVVLLDRNHVFRALNTLLYISFGILCCIGIVVAFTVPLFSNQIVKPISDLVEVALSLSEGHLEQKVEINTGDELETLGDSFNDMADAIKLSDGNMRSLLGSLTVGIFFFDREGHIAKERSQALGRILDGASGLNTCEEFFGKYCSVEPKTVATVLGCLWDDSGFVSPFDATVAMLGNEFYVDSEGRRKIIYVEYREINNSEGELDKVVVMIEDVTDAVEAQKKQKALSERIKRISMAASNTMAYQEFFQDSVRLMKAIEESFLAPEIKDMPGFKMDLHTLKGNTSVFEFSSLAKSIHHLEDLFTEDLTPEELKDQSRQQWEAIKDCWKFETTDISEVLGLQSSANYLKVSKAKIETLFDMLPHIPGDAGEVISGLVDYPVSEVFGKYQRMIQGLAYRSGKLVDIKFANDSHEISYEDVKPIDASLVHIFRNNIDHGIETQEDRESIGKPGNGIISIGCYKNKGYLHLVIKDDGGGINTDALADKAVRNKIWDEAKAKSASQEEKINLIFFDEMSTAEKLTETSGRGVGMSAVKASIEAVGGKISVYSEMGAGSQFEIDIPLVTSLKRIA